MRLYEFLMQNKMRFMHALVDRNKKDPRKYYTPFALADNPDLNKSTVGLSVQCKVQQDTLEKEQEAQADSLVERIKKAGKDTLILGKKALDRSKKALGYNVQDEQPIISHEAWATVFCRDPRQMAGIEKEVRMKEWKEVKDPQTRERYKEAGQRFYEYDRWILALFYNKPARECKATMIYRHPGPMRMGEFYHNLGFMLDSMTFYLKPHQQTNPPRKMPELERHVSDKEYIVIGENHPAAFAILVKGEQAEARLEIGNVPNLDQDTINAYVIAMVDKNYSAVPLSGNRIGLARRLQRKPTGNEREGIKMNIMNYAAEFVRRIEEPRGL